MKRAEGNGVIDEVKAGSKAHILIVEDDINLLTGIRATLEINGYSAATAINGVKALEYLREQTVMPDLIISDIMMPQLDGFGLFKELRKVPDWMTIPFIFLTARSAKQDVHKGKLVGVDDYIIKPFTTDDLLVAVEASLERQRVREIAHQSEMSELKRKILTILNHEFRTPLTFIVSYSDMVNNHKIGQAADDELVAFLQGIGDGATRLRRMIENFILLVELETGDADRTYEIRKTQIYDFDQLIENTCQQIIASVGKGQTFSIHTNHGQDHWQLVGDGEYLLKAIEHLAENAAKFSGAGTHISVSLSNQDGWVCIAVKDEGRGIPAHELDNIWETFYQIDRETHEDQGVGAGLKIVSDIVRMHGGDISVDSTMGEGSTFSITLPLWGGENS